MGKLLAVELFRNKFKERDMIWEIVFSQDFKLCICETLSEVLDLIVPFYVTLIQSCFFFFFHFGKYLCTYTGLLWMVLSSGGRDGPQEAPRRTFSAGHDSSSRYEWPREAEEQHLTKD